MAIRLERSGGLMFIRGTPDDPREAKRARGTHRRALWMMLLLLAMGILFASPIASGWPAAVHVARGFLAGVH